MNVESSLLKCESALDKLANFLERHRAIFDVCMVDFVTKNIFESVLQPGLQEDLLKCTDQDLITMPSKLIQNEKISTFSDSNLDELLNEMSGLTLEQLNVTTDLDSLKSEDPSLLAHFDTFMSEKKMHEVLKMSQCVTELCSSHNVKCLVDVGSGKAYLSQVLAAMQQDSCLLAIDSQSGNSKGAQKRSKNLEKQWEALIRRALCRASGEKPPRRGKNWKSKANAKENDDQNNDEENSQKSDSQKLELTNLIFDTLFVDTSTDLKSLFESHFGPKSEAMGLIGLHTCGNLAPASLRIFLANPTMKLCCNVGCCYHLLDEEFYTNPYDGNQDIKTPNFPLSTILRERQFWLGRPARMVAAQPMDRAINNQQLPSHSLLWRAILQHILLKHKPDLQFKDQQVGRIAAKSANFLDYVQKSFAKLGLTLQMSSEEIMVLHDEFSSKFAHKLNAFYQLRSLFAPLIEGLILLDRLTFLRQQAKVHEAHLVRLFDAVISPRCYALIVNKDIKV